MSLAEGTRPVALRTPADESGARRHAGSGALAAAIIVGIGFVLRLVAASGTELWLDEIWTLELVRPLTAPWQVLLDLPHDNNHPLNSLWVLLAGPEAPPLLLRLPAVVFGTLSVAAAGLVAREGAGRLAAMALVAASPALVNAGSEARGYAGLVLATLLAIAIVVRETDRPTRAGPLLLAGCAGLGLLSHVFMLETLLVLGSWSILVVGAQAGWKAGVPRLVRLFAPTAAVTAAILLCLAFAVARHGASFGGMFLATPESFLTGLADAARLLFGLPRAWPDALCAAVPAVAAAAALIAWRRDRLVLLFAGAGLVLPALLFALSVPNTRFARYFLVADLSLLLLAAIAFGRLWTRGTLARIVASGALAALLAAQTAASVGFIAAGRGHYLEAVAVMGAWGPFTYGSEHAARTRRIVDSVSRQTGLDARIVPREHWCDTPPQWLVRDPADPEEALPVCPGAERLTAEPFASFPSWWASGATWRLDRLRVN